MLICFDKTEAGYACKRYAYEKSHVLKKILKRHCSGIKVALSVLGFKRQAVRLTLVPTLINKNCNLSQCVLGRMTLLK